MVSTLAATTMCRFCRLGKPRVGVASMCLLKQVTPVTRSPRARATSSCTLLSCDLHGKSCLSRCNRLDGFTGKGCHSLEGRGDLLWLSSNGLAIPDPEQTLFSSRFCFPKQYPQFQQTSHQACKCFKPLPQAYCSSWPLKGQMQSSNTIWCNPLKNITSRREDLT